MKKLINKAGVLTMFMLMAMSANALEIVIPTMPTAPTPPIPPTFNSATTTATTTTATTTATSTATTSMVKVTIHKYVDGAHATAANANSASFQMYTTYNSTTTGMGSGNYSLNTIGYAPNYSPYEAMTVDMENGASYATNEVLGGNVVQACATGTAAMGTFMLSGYSYGDTYAQAMSATKSTTSPSMTNIMSDKHVIVWNTKCTGENGGGQIGGEVTGGATSTVGVLHVDGIDVVNGSGVANGTFESGWKYMFNITVPTSETHLSMKFSDWFNTVGSSTMSVANNMRISSANASSTGTILITGSNVYSTPSMHMMSDLNSAMAGMQVKVLVETSIPVNTVNGSYNTNYGIMSN